MHVTTVVAVGNSLPELGVQVATPTPSTMSNMAGDVYETISPEGLSVLLIMSAWGLITGGVVSCTVTLKLPAIELPESSVAVQVTDVVASSGKVLPEAGEQVNVTEASAISVAEAENVTAAPDGPVASAMMSAGKVRIGSVVSCTVTLKLPVAVLPRVSDAEQLTAVVPIAKVLPEAGEQVTETGPSTASFAVGEKVTIAPEDPVASTIILAGRLNTGGVVSTGAML